MKTLQTTAEITTDGQLTVKIPVNLPPGSYQIVLVIEEPTPQPTHNLLADFPVHSIGAWTLTLPLRREDLYNDDGR
jgi:hypothetical protein